MKADIKTVIKANDVAPIFVIEDNNPELALAVAEIANKLKNKLSIHICTESGANKDLNISADNGLMVSTDGGIRKTYFSGDLSNPTPRLAIDIKIWLLDNKNPLISRLDAQSQQELLKSEFLVIFAVDQEDKSQANKLAELRTYVNDWFKAYPTSHVVFSVIDGIKFANYLENLYGITPSNLPSFVITIPHDDLYYDSYLGKPFELDHDNFMTSVKAAIQGELTVLSFNFRSNRQKA